MTFMQIKISQDNEYISDVNLRAEFPNISFPNNPHDSDLPENIVNCYIEPRPTSEYAIVELDIPRFENNQWFRGWKITPFNQNEILQIKQSTLNNVRGLRDQKMKDFDWRYLRYDRETRLGLPTTDDIQLLDQYMQALADITQQENPFNVQWPIEP